MRKVFVIGIGAVNPDYVTVQAINALNEVDEFFIMDKGQEKEDLVRLRKEVCDRYIKDKSYHTEPSGRQTRRGTARHRPTSRPYGRGMKSERASTKGLSARNSAKTSAVPFWSGAILPLRQHVADYHRPQISFIHGTEWKALISR